MSSGADSLAGFLDRQHEAAYRDIVTYEDAQGIRCTISHMVPNSKAGVVQRGRTKIFYPAEVFSHLW